MNTIYNISHRWTWIGLVAVLMLCRVMPLWADVAQLTAGQAKRIIEDHRQDNDFIILDIRTPKEFAQGHISGALLLDYYGPKFSQGLQRLDKSKTYLIYCRSGNRSGRTLKLIEKMGFEKIYHLQRGIIDWIGSKYPLVQ